MYVNIDECFEMYMYAVCMQVSGFLGSDIADSEISMVSGLLQATHSLLEECR